jgi:hypothetical protein
VGRAGRRVISPSRRVVVLAIAAVAGAAAIFSLLGNDAHASNPTPQISGSVAAPSASEVSPICDDPSPASSLGPQVTLPSNPTSTVASPSGGVTNFTATSSNLYVISGSQLITYTLTGTEVSSFTLPSGFSAAEEVSQPVVDPSGNIYLSTYYGTRLDKFSPSGTVDWSVDPESGHPTGIFSVGTGSSFELMVSVVENSSGSEQVNLSTGATSGSFPLYDDFDYVSQTPSGNLLFSGNGYVETINSTGKVLSTFGAAKDEGNGEHTGSGSQFYYPAQAAQGTNGTIYTADPLNTIEATNAEGYLQNATTLDNNLTMGGDSFFLVGSTFYYQGGPPFNDGADNISSVSLSDLTDYLNVPQEPDDSLGWGAGLSTPESGNYFPPGTTPSVNANFNAWWAEDASHLELSYSVENDASLNAETVPSPTTIDLPTSTSALASIPLTLPAGDTASGPYLVQAELYDTSASPPTLLGTTCLPYTVGAAGDNLNLSSLPAGAGAGGPSDPRGVALNSQLGLTGLRALSFSWSNFLPNCNASAPTAATCGSAAMTFTNAPQTYFQAAALALADHVSYWIQISGGDATSNALVSNGWWGQDIQALVNYYAHPPSGCSGCAPVTIWEPWNESNNTGWSNAANYVSEVLEPFYKAVKAVEPGSTSTVIGGTTLEPAVSWWQQLITAGGLSYMDVAAVHPYTGDNESFAENNMPAQISQLEAILLGKPLWFTEVGWWSDGDYNYLSQANSVAQAMVWMKALDIPVWNYYFDEGTWGNDGVTFSLIQTDDNGDDYVKPSALATMTASAEMAGRPYQSMPSTGIPQTYQADFGPESGGSTQLAVVWSDGLDVTGAVTVTAPGGGQIPVTVLDQYGNATTTDVTSGQAYSLPLSEQLSYVEVPVGDTLSIGPTETYGTDLATTADGATATASSGTAVNAMGPASGVGWTSASGDSTPSLTINLAGTPTINRVVVDTQSMGSTAPGLRDYTVSADEPGTGWTTVATETGEYRDHEEQLTFSPVQASAIRLQITEVNFGGYYGGGIPPWWSPTQIAPAFLRTIEVYGGTDTPAQVAGSGLPSLTTGGGGGGTTTTTTSPSTTTTTEPPTTTTTTSTTTTSTTEPPTTTTTTTEPPTTTTTTTEPSSTTTTSTTEPPTTTTTTTEPPTTTTTTEPPTTTTTTEPPTTTTTGPPTTTTTVPPHQSQSGSGTPIPPAIFPFGGYWITTANGGIYAFGSVSFYGSGAAFSLGQSVVSMASTPDGKGYWLVTSNGSVFTFGDASFYGSTGGLTLNKPIVGMAPTPDGKGYWLVASDGGIFSFGDARFYGSTGGMTLNKPIVGMHSTPNSDGYWLVASDGGIFSFGDAAFYGSAGDLDLSAPTVAIS